MTRSTLATGLFVSAFLVACGGNAPDAPGAATTYNYVPPQAGAQLLYADTLVDNMNNTDNRFLSVSVTAVNPSSGYTASESDPSHDSIFSGAVDQTFYPTVYTFDVMGRATSWTVTGASGIPVTCQISGQPPGAPSPLTVGQTWNTTYTETCGANTGISITHNGTFVGIENVAVPAGTFSAYKFQSTTVSTVNGTIRTETTTRWRDTAASGSRILKSVATFTYSGTAPPQGALVSETQVLQSAQ